MSGTASYQNENRSIVDRFAVGRRKLATVHARFDEHSLSTPIRFVGFWLAVVLPFLYVPLLLNGLAGAKLTVFLALLGCHAVTLFVGHSYGQE